MSETERGRLWSNAKYVEDFERAVLLAAARKLAKFNPDLVTLDDGVAVLREWAKELRDGE